jgi:hypothetical protein
MRGGIGALKPEIKEINLLSIVIIIIIIHYWLIVQKQRNFFSTRALKNSGPGLMGLAVNPPSSSFRKI